MQESTKVHKVFCTCLTCSSGFGGEAHPGGSREDPEPPLPPEENLHHLHPEPLPVRREQCSHQPGVHPAGTPVPQLTDRSDLTEQSWSGSVLMEPVRLIFNSAPPPRHRLPNHEQAVNFLSCGSVCSVSILFSTPIWGKSQKKETLHSLLALLATHTRTPRRARTMVSVVP